MANAWATFYNNVATKLKYNERTDNMVGKIYCISNNINNKVYIGLTTCSLEYRWSRHLTEAKNVNNKKHLYKAMRKYGLEKFSIEQIDSADDFKELGM